MFNNCTDCDICCKGFLTANINNHIMCKNTKCFYLNNGCSIYLDRPDVCKNYQCAWSQNLFSEKMKPNISNLLISVEIDRNNKQFLKIIPVKNQINIEDIDEINTFCLQNNTYFVIAIQ